MPDKPDKIDQAVERARSMGLLGPTGVPLVAPLGGAQEKPMPKFEFTLENRLLVCVDQLTEMFMQNIHAIVKAAVKAALAEQRAETAQATAVADELRRRGGNTPRVPRKPQLRFVPRQLPLPGMETRENSTMPRATSDPDGEDRLSQEGYDESED